jgi:predicted alpha/beta-fold hydrolase
VPFDLAACARTLDGPGFWRWVYRTRFLRTLKKKSLRKARMFPGKLDLQRIGKARTLFEFDDAVTAAVHGFCGAPNYYAQSSSGQFVQRVRVPLLLLSALDDPFIPPECIPRVAPECVTLEITEKGGHLGFVEGPPWHPRFYAERRAVEFLASQIR